MNIEWRQGAAPAGLAVLLRPQPNREDLVIEADVRQIRAVPFVLPVAQ